SRFFRICFVCDYQNQRRRRGFEKILVENDLVKNWSINCLFLRILQSGFCC
ncbi:unnamed protein product, partial [Arabidopsis halleri]